MLGLITSSVIEEYLVVLEQAFNPSNVVVAVSVLDADDGGQGDPGESGLLCPT